MSGTSQLLWILWDKHLPWAGFYKIRPILIFDSWPHELEFYSPHHEKSSIASLPMLNFNSIRTIDTTILVSCLINMVDPSDTVFTNELVLALREALPTSTVVNNLLLTQDSTNSGIEKVTQLVNYIFDVIIGVTMFLCFFALSANMSANIFEQTKEIAVLRALGLRKNRIKCLYFYEALILVLASSILGVIIGLIVGYTMTLQTALL